MLLEKFLVNPHSIVPDSRVCPNRKAAVANSLLVEGSRLCNHNFTLLCDTLPRICFICTNGIVAVIKGRVSVHSEPPVVHEVVAHDDGEPLFVGDVLVLCDEDPPGLLRR